jgi:methyl-coenzyme M reductase subunit C
VGNVPSHFIPKIKKILMDIEIPVLVISQAPTSFEDLASQGIGTSITTTWPVMTKGRVVEMVDGVVRGQRCSPEKIEEIIAKTRRTLITLTTP